MIQVTHYAKTVGPARRVPLPGSLSSKHQEEMEEEESGHEQEAHYTRVCDEGEGEGTRRDLTCKRKYNQRRK